MAGTQRQIGRAQVEGFVSRLFEQGVHAKRVESLANGVDGVLHPASLGIRAIGQGLAAAQGLAPKHAIKQVDRLLSNPKLSLEDLFTCWVGFVVGERGEIVVNFDWTEFEDSDQSMVVLGMQSCHGRSTPLVWKAVRRSELGGQRNAHEDDLLLLFAGIVSGDVRVNRGGRSRLRRPQALPAAQRGSRLRLPDPPPWGDHGRGRAWRGPPRSRLGGPGRAHAPPHEHPRHGRARGGAGHRLCARAGDEGRLVPGQ